MNKLLLASAAIVAVTSFSNANAEEFPKWYLGLSGGIADQNDSEYKGAASGDLEFNTGYTVSGALGYNPATMPNVRLELEASTHSQSAQKASGGAGGKAKADALMVNAFYDFSDSGVIPYVGAGLGGAKFSLGSPNMTGSSGKETLPAYQVMAGVAFQFEELPRTEWTLGYRYFAPFSEPEVKSGGTVEYEYDNHSLEASARFKF